MKNITNSRLNKKYCEKCSIPLKDNNIKIPMYCSEECARAKNIPEKDIQNRISKEI